MKPTLTGYKIEAERLRHGPMDFVLAEDPKVFDLQDDPEYRFEDPVRGAIRAQMVGSDTVLVTGTVHTVAGVACARCLEPLRLTLRADVHVTFMMDERLLDPVAFPELHEDPVFWYDGEMVYPAEALRELLLLELPTVAACELEPGDICPIRNVKVGPMTFGPNSPAGRLSTGEEEFEDDQSFKGQMRRLREQLDGSG